MMNLDQASYRRRKPMRLKEFDYAAPNQVFFLTLCTKGKIPLFADKGLNGEVVQCIREEKERVGHAIYVYCLMPDHIHLLSSPLESRIPVTQFMGGLSSKITRLSWQHGFSGKVLQRSFYDHILKRDESLRKVAEYILDNPVRRGLAEKWNDHPFCGLIDEWPPL